MRLGTVAGAVALLLSGVTIPASAQAVSSDQFSGFYAGVSSGGAATGGSSRLNLSAGGIGDSQSPSQSFRQSGLIGGAQAGYNLPISSSKWTVGIETDFDGSRVGR
jgi:hypothetical protein